MRGTVAKRIRRIAKQADWAPGTRYVIDERTGAVLLAQCERWMIKVIKRIYRSKLWIQSMPNRSTKL